MPTPEGFPPRTREGEVAASQYLVWRTHAHPALLQTAFYLPTTDYIQTSHRIRTWSIGRATSNFPLLLHIPVSQSLLNSRHRSGIVPLVLSHHTWAHDFGSNPAIIGRTLHFRGWNAKVVAIAPTTASYLPMQMSAWTVETSSLIRNLSDKRNNYGFMLARLAPFAAGHSRVLLTSHVGTRLDMYLVPTSAYVAFYRHELILGFASSLLICCLMIPAILFLSPETGLSTEQLPLRKRLRVWLFFLAKLLLLLPTLLCGPLLLAHWVTWSLASAGNLQAILTLGGMLVVALWAIHDQRQRCPTASASGLPRARRRPLAHLPVDQRNRITLRRGARPLTRSRLPHQLVPQPALASPGCLLAQPVPAGRIEIYAHLSSRRYLNTPTEPQSAGPHQLSAESNVHCSLQVNTRIKPRSHRPICRFDARR